MKGQVTYTVWIVKLQGVDMRQPFLKVICDKCLKKTDYPIVGKHEAPKNKGYRCTFCRVFRLPQMLSEINTTAVGTKTIGQTNPLRTTPRTTFKERM